MSGWNCRMVERNGDPVKMGWLSEDALDAELAAAKYCHRSEVWDSCSWSDGDEAIVEVELHGGEDGTHRIVIQAYSSIEFSAETLDETV